VPLLEQKDSSTISQGRLSERMPHLNECERKNGIHISQSKTTPTLHRITEKIIISPKEFTVSTFHRALL
jgi:hypothetical protein